MKINNPTEPDSSEISLSAKNVLDNTSAVQLDCFSNEVDPLYLYYLLQHKEIPTNRILVFNNDHYVFNEDHTQYVPAEYAGSKYYCMPVDGLNIGVRFYEDQEESFLWVSAMSTDIKASKLFYFMLSKSIPRETPIIFKDGLRCIEDSITNFQDYNTDDKSE